VPGPWATPEQVREWVVVPDEVDDATLERQLRVASDVLAGLSGVDSATETTVVPAGCECGEAYTGPTSRVDVGAAGVAGRSPYWWRVGPDVVTASGSCTCELVLPANPVLEVVKVEVDNVAVPAEHYELVDASRLRRLSGARWPAGRTAITYRSGGRLGEAALRAVSELAVELSKASRGLACNLPARAVSVARQGLSVAAVDPSALLAGGQTGLYVVDLFLASTSSRRPAPRNVAVLSPDAPRYDRHRRTP